MIEKKDFRTYKRRAVKRKSGFKASGKKTGGECIILNSASYTTINEKEEFIFLRDKLVLEELFQENIGMLAFGGYVYSKFPAKIMYELDYKIGEYSNNLKKTLTKPLESMNWNPIGFHKEFNLDFGNVLENVKLTMTITSPVGNTLQFISFDLNIINSNYYKTEDLKVPFHQKTSMHIPHIYYLNTLLPFTTYLVNKNGEFTIGDPVVLKSCNRCTRYLPININNELKFLGFSLHCKKKAPCTHQLFNSYNIDNIKDIDESTLKNLTKSNIHIENNKVKSYYGHQLECRACKKFFVNAPLNPRRDSQQFREDSLRRRAIEVLVNNLLAKDLIHHEFRKMTKKEFSEYIWNKFDRRCFKCGRKLTLDEMHLDHTMPLAYLYRLDETATCLCSTHNSAKSDHFPVDFYTEEELINLQKITGLSYEILHSRSANPKVLSLLMQNVVWFFDVFLNDKNYQKVRDGILTADKILESLNRIVDDSSINLIDMYYEETGKYPTTVSIS